MYSTLWNTVYTLGGYTHIFTKTKHATCKHEEIKHKDLIHSGFKETLNEIYIISAVICLQNMNDIIITWPRTMLQSVQAKSLHCPWVRNGKLLRKHSQKPQK